MLETAVQRLLPATSILTVPSRFDAALWFERLSFVAFGMIILTLGMLVLDGRTLNGEPVWLKPTKFSLSFTIFFATLAFVANRLSSLWRKSWSLATAALVSAAAFFFEMAYISAQAAQGEASHFNESTPFHELMYGLMGTGATVLMLTVGFVGIASLLDRDARLESGLRLGIGLGFLTTVILTFWVAGALAEHGGRYIGSPSEDHLALPVFGWSMEVGDLRAAHFFALHSMQVLPAFGLLADRFELPPRSVWIVAALYGSFTGIVFVTAQQGIPFISP